MLRCNVRNVLQGLCSSVNAALCTPAPTKKGPREAGLFEGLHEGRAAGGEALPQCAPAAASAPAPPRAGRDSQITGTSSRNISADA